MQYIKKNIIEWVEVDNPIIDGGNQAIVRPLAIARCDLDIPIIRGETLFRPSFPIGHEFIAEVVTLSNDIINNFKIGDKVAVMFQISCGSCPSCDAMTSHHCTTSPELADYGMGKGGKQFGGALSDFIKVPYAKQMLLPLDQDCDVTALASLTDNMTDAYRTVHPYLTRPDMNSVLIIGGMAASIGLYSIEIAKALGAQKISYLAKRDLQNKSQLFMAQELGAQVHEVDKFPIRWHDMHDIVVDTSGDLDGFNLALRSARPEGVCTSLGVFFSNKVPMPYLEMYNKGVQLYVGRTRAKEYAPQVLKLIQDKQINMGKIVSQRANFIEAKDAWLEPGIKLVVTT